MGKRVFTVILLAAALIGAAREASAQWPTPLEGRFTLHFNGVGQNPGGDVSFEHSAAFDLFDERGVTERRQTINGTSGGLVDVGASYRVLKYVGFGLSYTSKLTSSGEAALRGTLPSPEFYDRPRSANASVPNLQHSESGIHVNAIVHVPFVQKVDFAFFAGPSFLTVTQDLVQTPTLANFSDPLQPAISLAAPPITQASKSATGFNAGAEVTYAVLPNVAVAALLRYVRASVDFDVDSGQSINLKAGNAQFGAGIRLRF